MKKTILAFVYLILIFALASCDFSITESQYSEDLQMEQLIQSEQSSQDDQGYTDIDETPQTIEISSDGYWIINGVKTDHKAIGNDGINGTNGKDGIDGIGIESTTLDEKGNLIIRYTDGNIEIIEHKWIYIYTLRPSTCEDSGLDIFYCENCSLVRATVIDAFGHSYVNGTCTICGEIDLDYTVSEYSKGLKYTLSDDATYYTLSGMGTCTDTDIIIPIVHNGLPVLSIDEGAFYSCKTITSIKIPDSVISIGDSAFEKCSRLTSIIIPDSVRTIGQWAFYDCYGLVSVTIGNGITTISTTAFGGCLKLAEIINKSSLDIIAGDYNGIGRHAIEVHKGESKIVNHNDYLFYTYNDVNYLLGYIGSDTVLTLPQNYKGEEYKIYSYSFYNLKNVINVTIPNSVTSIGSCAFLNCTGLTGVYITDIAAWCNISFGDLDSNPLRYAGHLYLTGELVTELIIPDGIITVKNYAFYSCDSFTHVTIPNSVTSIGSYAFERCSSLIGVTIPNSSIEIASTAFIYCNSNLYTEYEYGKYIGDANNPYSVLIELTNKELDTYDIHENTKIIASNVFSSCSRLTNITIPNGITAIGSSSFYLCSNLTKIIIPDGITMIGPNAFRGCSSLTSINIPNGVISIGGFAFYGCSSLPNVTIGNKVTSIGDYAFEDCSSLTSINYNGATAEWNAITKGSSWNSNTGTYVIYCTDGKIEKDGTVTYY